MPLITVELPSREVKKLDIDFKTTLRQIAVMLELTPENVVFFIGRFRNELGTFMGPASDTELGYYNTTTVAIVLKTEVDAKYIPFM
jgi:hypothetical protein